MFPTDRLNKAFVLAPLSGVTPQDFNTPASGITPTGFKVPNFKLERNIEAWGHLSQRDQPGFFADTGTKVARLWADWNNIQNTGPTFNPVSLEALDSNIAAAKRAGLTVILTSRGFPGWVTGYAALRSSDGLYLPVPDAGGDIEAYAGTFPASDRDAARGAFRAARDDQGHPDGTTAKGFGSAQLGLRWPGELTADNKNRARTDLLESGKPWNQWITFLANRYHPSRPADTIQSAPPRVSGATIDVLEIVNEPNLECWPQFAADKVNGKRFQIAPRMTAAMLQQAATIDQTVNANLGAGAPLYFAAPGTSDKWLVSADEDRFTSSYDLFLKKVAQTLGARFEPGERFVFTHHNYLDIENPRRGRPARGHRAGRTTNSAAWVMAFMLGRQVKVTPESGRTISCRWRGWPSATSPCLALTEGGARLKKGIARADQPARIRTAFNETRDGRYGDNIVLFSNFLTWRDQGRPETRSWLVDTATRGDGAVDFALIADAKPEDEPTTAQYNALHRPSYDKWKGLVQKK